MLKLSLSFSYFFFIFVISASNHLHRNTAILFVQHFPLLNLVLSLVFPNGFFSRKRRTRKRRSRGFFLFLFTSLEILHSFNAFLLLSLLSSLCQCLMLLEAFIPSAKINYVSEKVELALRIFPISTPEN